MSPASPSPSKLLVEILKGESNYRIWAERTKMLLLERDLLEALYPTEELKVEEYQNLDKFAMIIIKGTISDQELLNVLHFKTAKEIWEYLERKYSRSDPISIMNLLREIYSVRKGSRSVTNYLHHVRQLVTQLNSVAQPSDRISDTQLMVIIMLGLPEEYSSFVTAISLRDPGHPLSFAEFERNLLSAEQLSSEQRPTISVTTNRCGRCKRHGHKAKNCKEKAKYCKFHKSTSHSTSECRTRPQASVNAVGPSTMIDSGASHSCISDKSLFSSYSATNMSLFLADGKTRIVAKGTGTARIPDTPISIPGALHTPGIPTNLISVADLTDAGYQVDFLSHSCKILQNGQSICEIPRSGKLYLASAVDSETLHRRFGHLSDGQLRLLLSGKMYDGKLPPLQEQPCDPCAIANHRRKPFKSRPGTRAKKVLDIVHTDLWGPLSVPSQGFRYFASFIDDATRYSYVTFLQNKSDLLDAFKSYKALVENYCERKIKAVVCDNGGEYTSHAFKKVCDEAGILIRYTPPYTPELNGVSECFNRVLLVKARALMAQSNLGPEFWPYAVRTANYQRNISPTEKLGCTPYQMWHGRKPTISHLRQWGCRAYVLREGPQKGSKIDPRRTPMIFVGYHNDDQGYILYDPETRKTVVRRNVSFDETTFPTDQNNTDVACPSTFLIDMDPFTEIPPEQQDVQPTQIHQRQDSTGDTTESYTSDEDAVIQMELLDDDSSADTDLQPNEVYSGSKVSSPRKISLGREMVNISKGMQLTQKRTDKVNSKYAKRTVSSSISAIHLEPRSFKQAIQSDESPHWKKAMELELASHAENNTWTLSPLPPGRKCVSSKWVFTHKHDAQGNVVKHKARLVAVGTTQKHGVDYTDTFSPVARWETIRLLLSIALERRWIVDQLDVTTAFLYGTIDHEIYMKQPPGFVDHDNPNYVCKLNRSIYGLKQSPRIWNARLSDCVKQFGLIQSQLDPCIFYSQTNDLLFVEFVDDILVTGTPERRLALKNALANEFKIKDEGPVSHFLNVNITRDGDRLTLSQKSYITKLLERFGMSECYVSPLPANPSDLDLNAKPLPPEKPYRQLIGALVYLAHTTRPDIAFVTGYLARQVQSPSLHHWKIGTRVLRYLKGTMDLGITMNRSQTTTITAFVDSDHGGDKQSRRSTTGYAVFCGDNLISWHSKLQPIIADSTMEAEYIALWSVVKELRYIRNLLTEIGYAPTQPASVFEDNQACLKLAEGTGTFHPRSKHIDIRYHASREAVNNGTIKIDYVRSKQNIADLFTKILPLSTFTILSEAMRAFRSGE